jgi:hypothetical protein
LPGQTGEIAVPRVLFSWNWSDIQFDSCDRRPGEEFVFCDPTQFSIALAKRLEKMRQALSVGDSDAFNELSSFSAYLMEDTFSEDFQKDFVFFYENSEFFRAPSFFSSSSTPFHLLFRNPTRLDFKPRTIAEPGLYRVSLEMDFDSASVFFVGGQPAVKITVNFDKIQAVGAALPDSSLYHLPFNGLVGSLRVDEDGQRERKGYGLGFSQSPKIALQEIGQEIVLTPTVSGTRFLKVGVKGDLKELNNKARGRVLSIDTTTPSLVFSPAIAVPVLLGLEENLGTAEASFVLQEGERSVGEDLDFVSLWSGVAVSPSLDCKMFSGEKLFENRADVRAAGLGAASCAVQEGREHAFGFRFAPVQSKQRVFLAGLVYVPVDRDLLLRNACSVSSSLVITPTGTSQSFNEPVSLRAPANLLNSLDDVLDLVREGKVCVAQLGQEAIFYWNQEFFFSEESLKELLSQAESAWKFNWDNYVCEREPGV